MGRIFINPRIIDAYAIRPETSQDAERSAYELVFTERQAAKLAIRELRLLHHRVDAMIDTCNPNKSAIPIKENM